MQAEPEIFHDLQGGCFHLFFQQNVNLTHVPANFPVSRRHYLCYMPEGNIFLGSSSHWAAGLFPELPLASLGKFCYQLPAWFQLTRDVATRCLLCFPADPAALGPPGLAGAGVVLVAPREPRVCFGGTLWAVPRPCDAHGAAAGGQPYLTSSKLGSLLIVLFQVRKEGKNKP